MKKILHIISSPRGGASVSIQLGNAVVSKIQETYPESIVKEKNLAQHPFPHLEEVHLNAFFTPAESRSAENLAAIQHSDEAIAELQEADIIVIGVPFYNFGVPSTLKAWVDHIARAGVTFQYTEQGPQGLITGKKVYLAVASGGIYSDGPMQAYDFATPYLKGVLGFLGMTDVTVFRAEGASIPVVKDTALEKGIESILIA
ncbi:FMN-dependent NADH-azoreductase [Pedobacter agri]|uniref:FMN dependent NADH:quinone oxidoreductase n=1 Tax=Pedobacter agri TaxID=454586 RepID=A0A9X3DE78_9SPHI|nr:FMN-dependent NADH-azoreductase [Pedobacter agri]MCX3264501.1 FMN-dependent NADH-azoreductase [Pedobacter agri]MDQ1140728.1 FMN-dependent NADH-azoreductase [Pedobacter agri]